MGLGADAYGMDSCPSDFETRYLVYMITSVILVLLQSLLFIHTLRHEWTQRHEKRFTKSWAMRVMYISMQIIALIWVCDVRPSANH